METARFPQARADSAVLSELPNSSKQSIRTLLLGATIYAAVQYLSNTVREFFLL